VGKHWWPAPEAGEIVWRHFPENKGINPGPKPRPALIVKVFDDHAPHFIVLVAYGTNQKTDPPRSGEFLIADHDAAVYQLASPWIRWLFSIHSLPKFLARLEMRHVIGRHLHRLTCFWVASCAWWSVIEGEAPEATNLYAISL